MEKLVTCPHALRAVFDGHVPGFLHFLHYLHRFLMAQKGSIAVKTGDLSTRTSCWDLRLSLATGSLIGTLRKQIARIARIATFFDGAGGRFHCNTT